MDVAPKLFEGDIDQSSEPDEPSVQKRNAQRARQRLWTAKTIPYVISDIHGEIVNDLNPGVLVVCLV